MSDTIKALLETARCRAVVAANPDYDARAVSQRYDPDHLFHVIQNIAPAKWR